MAQINKPSEYFNTKLYTGNGSTQSITGVGFQPDMVWIKDRGIDGDNHQIYDAIRGTTKSLQSNNTNAEITFASGLTAFDSDGFSLGSEDQHNGSSDPFVSWNWKANGAGVSNTDGSITSTVSANTTSGFSIVQFTGTGANATVGHGLGVAPHQVVVKRLDGAGFQWMVFNKDVGNTYYLNWDDDGAFGGPSNNYWNSTDPTSSVFSVNTDTGMNASGGTYIAYCFANVKGFSKFGSYVGNGNADGTFVYTGFKPAFVMIKNTSAAENWYILDNKRPSYNTNNYYIKPNVSDVEGTSTSLATSLLSNGFKIENSDTSMNTSGQTYIYMAFAEQPLVGTNGIPATAR